MKKTYETLALKFNDVNWGSGELDAAVTEIAAIKPPVVRLVFADGHFDIQNFKEEKVTPEQRAKCTRVEVLLRDPVRAMRRLHDDFMDKPDHNEFNWCGGQRGIGKLPEPDAMRGTPMFFRHDGSPVDLLGMYRGQTCFLALNGPSLNNLDKGKLKFNGVSLFGVNNGGHSLTPNFWTCVDDPTRFMPEIWRNPNIMKFVPFSHFSKPVWDTQANREGPLVWQHPNVVGFRRNERFVASQYLTEQTINWGNHSDLGGGRSCMLSAVRIIHLLGFKKLYLLGCDFNMSETARYFFDEERTTGAIKGNNSSYGLLIDRFTQLQEFFLKDGFQVFNCNPDSALKAFPTADFDQAIDSVLIDPTTSARGMYTEKPKRDTALTPPGA